MRWFSAPFGPSLCQKWLEIGLFGLEKASKRAENDRFRVEKAKVLTSEKSVWEIVFEVWEPENSVWGVLRWFSVH